jgi:hypothetical protein
MTRNLHRAARLAVAVPGFATLVLCPAITIRRPVAAPAAAPDNGSRALTEYSALVTEQQGMEPMSAECRERNENLNRQLAEEKLLREGEPGQRVRPPQDPPAVEPR